MNNGQNASLTIRLYTEDLETFKKAAKIAGIPLSEFVRSACAFKALRMTPKRRKRK